MKANTIFSLYNGEYTCIEKSTYKDKLYIDSLSKCITTEEKLKKLLDSETYSLVEKFLEYHSLMSIVELEDTFVEGFSFGVSLLLEALLKK